MEIFFILLIGIWLALGIRQVIENQKAIFNNQEKIGEGLLTISKTIKEGIIETNQIIDENFKMIDNMMNDLSGDKN